MPMPATRSSACAATPTSSTWRGAWSTPGRSARIRACSPTATSSTPRAATSAASPRSRKWTGTATPSGNTPKRAPTTRRTTISSASTIPKLGTNTTLYIAAKTDFVQRLHRRRLQSRQRPLHERPGGRDCGSGHGGQRGLGMVLLRSRHPGLRREQVQLRRRGQEHLELRRPAESESARPPRDQRLAALQLD